MTVLFREASPSRIMFRSGILMSALALLALVARRAGADAFQDESTSAPLPPQNITAQMLQADARLDRVVTLRLRHATIAEALAEISKQSGVRISANERDGAADESVAVFCKDLPAHRILNALWATMSYQDGPWEWRRNGSKGSFVYVLLQPDAARKLRQKLRYEVEHKLEQDAARLMDAVDASDAQKDAVVKDIYGDPEVGFQKYYTFTKERLWADVRSLKEALTPEQRQAVLHGDAQIRVPLASLSPATQAYYQAERDGVVQRASSRGLRAPNGPREIWFSRTQYSGTPALVIEVPGTTTHYPVIGGIPVVLSFWAKMKALWKDEGDAKDDPAEARTMTRPPDAQPEPEPAPRPRITIGPDGQVVGRPQPYTGPTALDRLTMHFEEIADGAQVPLVARLPQDPTRTGLSDLWGTNLTEYWKQLWNRDLMEKWHDGVQIVSNIGWPLEDPPVPGWFVRRLRKDARPGKLLPFDDEVAAADLLTRDQIGRLEREFPTMKGVAAARGLLAAFRRYPDLVRQAASPQGLPLTQQAVAALRTLLTQQQAAALEGADARFLTISVQEGKIPDVPTRDVMFAFRAAGGHVIKAFAFSSQPQPKEGPREDAGHAP